MKQHLSPKGELCPPGDIIDIGPKSSRPAPNRFLVAREAARNIIALTREDPEREGLARTPERFAKAYDYLLSGYDKSPEQVVGEGIFATESDSLVLVSQIEFYSMCEHHLLPFWGKATVAYFPREKMLGLSKIPRIIDLFARRIQVQERLTDQVARAIDDLIGPKAVLVQMTAQHLCMMMRGVEKQLPETTTRTIKNFHALNEVESLQFKQLMT